MCTLNNNVQASWPAERFLKMLSQQQEVHSEQVQLKDTVFSL